MSLRKYNKPLNLNLKPSKSLLYFIFFIHLLALSVLFLNLKIYLIFKIIIFAMILVSLYLSLKKCNSVAFGFYFNNLKYKKEMEWLLEYSDKRTVKALLQKNWIVFSGLVILYFKDDSNKNITTIILSDMVRKNDLRILKLHLSQIK
jgi:hypothetical protein